MICVVTLGPPLRLVLPDKIFGMARLAGILEGDGDIGEVMARARHCRSLDHERVAEIAVPVPLRTRLLY